VCSRMKRRGSWPAASNVAKSDLALHKVFTLREY